MEDQRISFNTAKLAAEKGFNLKQRFGMETSLYHKSGEHTYYANYGFMGSGLSDGYISAPTQSLLQKWIREIYNLHIVVTYNQFGYGYMYSILDIKAAKAVKYTTGGPNDKFTYEEALEQGLQEALQLIK